jgi:uncharacterized membrane protein
MRIECVSCFQVKIKRGIFSDTLYPFLCLQVEEYEHKLKQLEDICNPIITRMYQGGGGGGGAAPGGGGAEGGGGGQGPKIEEVD